MDVLRRLFGRDSAATASHDAAASGATEATSGAPGSGTGEHDEAAYERELLREEAARLDELQQRQLRYAEYSWQPPAQGGPRRADDTDAGREGDAPN
jgi:hypothetical protein